MAAVAVVALVAPAVARASHGPLPWGGGMEETSALEERAQALASALAGRPVRMYCNGNTDWLTLAAQERFDAAQVWGYVFFRWSWDTYSFQPLDYSHLAESACWYADEFWGAADKWAVTKRCRLGTTTEYETRVRLVKKWAWTKKRVKVAGKWETKRTRKRITVRRSVTVPVQVPVVGDCPDYRQVLFAFQTFTHEAMHLRGHDSESLAECYGMQLLGRSLVEYWDTPIDLAREMAEDFWNVWYLDEARKETEYYRSDCYDGGPHDLYPSSSVWPAGF